MAADRGDARRSDERPGPRRPVRRRHAEALVDQQHDADVRRVRGRARRVGAVGLQDGLRLAVPRAVALGLLRRTSSASRGRSSAIRPSRTRRTSRWSATGPSFRFPQSALAYFQFVFAAITPILMLGSVLGRVNFKAWIPFVALWCIARLHGRRVPALGRRLLRPPRRGRLLRRLRDPPVRRRVGLRRGGGDRADDSSATARSTPRTTWRWSRSAPDCCGSAGTASTVATRTSRARPPRRRCSTRTCVPRSRSWCGSAGTT